MYLDRYASDTLINGKILSTNSTIRRIHEAVKSGNLRTTNYVISEGDRLDVIAGRYYGDGRLWWVIAAASNIGWWLQVPPGTRIVIPNDLSQIQGLI